MQLINVNSKAVASGIGFLSTYACATVVGMVGEDEQLEVGADALGEGREIRGVRARGLHGYLLSAHHNMADDDRMLRRTYLDDSHYTTSERGDALQGGNAYWAVCDAGEQIAEELDLVEGVVIGLCPRQFSTPLSTRRDSR